MLSLAIRLNAEVNQGRITSDLLKREVTVITDGNGLRLRPFPEGTNEDLQHGMFNFIQIALSASALTVDEALKEVFGKCADEKNPARVGIRVMVNQLRNAFAHNPWRPKWQIYSKYRKTYSITLDDGSKFDFDATNLHGDGVKPEQVGGLEFWVKVLQHCERIVVS